VRERRRASTGRLTGKARSVPDALLLVDVVSDFRHEDGEALLRSFRRRHPALVAALERARGEGVPVIYANDNRGLWDGDAPALVRQTIAEGRAGDLVAAIAPTAGDRFLVKPHYSAFEHTPLEPLLDSLGVERLRLAGTATEMCVAETAIDASRRGLEVVVLAEACACIDPERERAALAYLGTLAGVEVR
jgi:nicotinamidase-related amidase